MKICRPRLDFGQVQGVLCKVPGIFLAGDLFSNEKFDGPGPWRLDRAARLGSTVDRGGVDNKARRCLADVRRTVARAHRWSPVVVEEDEPVPEGCSSEYERRWRGGATVGEGRRKGARERCHTQFLCQNQVLIVCMTQDQLFHTYGPKVFTDNQMSRIKYNYYISIVSITPQE
jgi:hypothetical protein